MSHLFYNTVMVCLGIVGLTLYPILRLFGYAHAQWVGEKLWPQPLERQPQLWIHAVSVGEMKIALTLLEALPKACRNALLLTTTTPAGMAFLERNLPPGAMGRILPWDVNWALRRFFKGHSVPTLILVETEIWPKLFSFVKREGADLVIINARLSSKTLRFKRMGILKTAVSRIDLVAARSNLDASRFCELGLNADKAVVTGNIKFDFALNSLPEGPLRTWLADGEPTVIFASMGTDEAQMLAPAVAELFALQPKLRVLWAPRQIQDAEHHLHALASFEPQLRSKTAAYRTQLLILDTMGELSDCFSHGAVSLVGGSFNDRGGQNFLESLQVGTPAIVGPSCENFRLEVAEALDAGAILQVSGPGEVAPNLNSLLNDSTGRAAMATAGKTFLERHTGAVARTVGVLLDSVKIPHSEVI